MCASAVGCSAAPEDHVGVTRSTLSGVGANINLTFDTSVQSLRNPRIHANAETSVAVVPMADGSRNVVVGMNARSDPYAPALPGISWAVIAGGGTSIRLADSSDPANSWPPPAGWAGSFDSYYSDPGVVWTGHPGVVAFVVLFHDQNYYRHVALATSIDGGLTFSQARWISSAGGSDVGADQPMVAADTTTGEVWVWWRNYISANNQSSWLARAAIGATGTIAADPPIELTTSITEHGAGAPPGRRGATINTGVSGNVWLAVVPRVRDIAQTVYLAFPDKWTFPPGGIDCASTGWTATTSMTWRLAWSQGPGFGQDAWFTNQLTTDPAWPYCIANRTSGQNRNRPQVAYDPMAYAIVTTLSRGLSTMEQGYVGQRAMLFQRGLWQLTDAETDGCHTIWYPQCLTDSVQKIHNDNPGYANTIDWTCTQAFPALAVSLSPASGDRAVWSWHDDRTGADRMRGASLQPGFVGGGPGGCDSITDSASTQSNVAFGPNVPTVIPSLVPWERVAWLDYEGLGADPATGELWAAWADYRTARAEFWPCNGNSLCNYSLSDVQVASFFP